MTSSLPFCQPGTVFFDSSRPGVDRQHHLLFTHPVATISTQDTREIPWLLAELDKAISSGYYAAGYIDYEGGYAFERWQPYNKPGIPLAWFGIYDAYREITEDELAGLSTTPDPSSVQMSAPQFSMDLPAYTRCIQRIKEYIRNGDVYQINFTGAFSFDFSGSSFDLYRLLRNRQGVSYGALVSIEDADILSFSPELFFNIEGDTLTTRPMKGTIGRGNNEQEDSELGSWLINDEKNRAENVMIVDLLRNDLSRVSEVGSVKVPAIYSLETYETLFQMTSTVTSTLRKGVSTTELFEALYPGGSITGAPKIRAMEIIQELEQQPRGVYCGTMGYMAPNHRSAFNIAIRTLTLSEGKGRMGTGSGIVWDSDPAAEYEECILKGKFLRIDERLNRS